MHKGSYTPPIVIMQVSDWNFSPEAFHLRANLQRLEFNNWMASFFQQESIWALFSHLMKSFASFLGLWVFANFIQYHFSVFCCEPQVFGWEIQHFVHLRRRHVLLENGLLQAKTVVKKCQENGSLNGPLQIPQQNTSRRLHSSSHGLNSAHKQSQNCCFQQFNTPLYPPIHSLIMSSHFMWRHQPGAATFTQAGFIGFLWYAEVGVITPVHATWS